MPITQDEAVASLKILVAVAKADGTLHDDERKSLSAALEAFELPVEVSLDALLGQKVDVDAELGKLVSGDARAQTYRSAYFMVHADGACTKEEQEILDRIETFAQIAPEEKNRLARLFVTGPSLASLAPKSRLSLVADPAVRAKTVRSTVLKYGAVSAALGAFPIPGFAIATDLAVVALQIKMIRDIGQYWGHEVDRNAAKSMLYGLGLGTGARLAVNNLAKLVPGWGSALGATTSFASTYALGKIIEKFFAEDQKGDIARLRNDFKAAEKEGETAFAANDGDLAAAKKSSEDAVSKLMTELKEGRISQEELDRRLTELC